MYANTRWALFHAALCCKSQKQALFVEMSFNSSLEHTSVSCHAFIPCNDTTTICEYLKTNTHKSTNLKSTNWTTPELLSCGISSDEAVAPSFKSLSQQQSSSEYWPGKRNLIRMGGKFCVSHWVTETAFYQKHTQGMIEVVHNNAVDITIILLSGFLTLRRCHQWDKCRLLSTRRCIMILIIIFSYIKFLYIYVN